MKRFFPDSLYSIENISFSTFLYFNNEKVEIHLHQGVSMPLGGFNAPAFLQYLEEKKPAGKISFWEFIVNGPKAQMLPEKAFAYLNP